MRFDEARASMTAVLDGELHAGVLLAVEGAEQLAGFAAALRERCVDVALAQPLVWCAEGEAEYVSREAAALARSAGASIALRDDYPPESFCPSWTRLREALGGDPPGALEAMLAPARPTAYMVGAADEQSARLVAAALCRLDARRAVVLHGGGAVELCDGAVCVLDVPEAEGGAVRVAGLRLYAGWLAATPAAGVAMVLNAGPARRAA